MIKFYFQFLTNIVAWMETSVTCPVAQLFPIQDPIPAELAVASDVWYCWRSPSAGPTPQWHFTYSSRRGTEHLNKDSGINFTAVWWLRYCLTNKCLENPLLMSVIFVQLRFRGCLERPVKKVYDIYVTVHSIVNTNTCTTSTSQVKIYFKKPYKNSYMFRSTTIFRELQYPR
jgi:hypothetical protein